jgi:4-aminobutyrate aminotransferase
VSLSRSDDLYGRDGRAIGALQKLRFFPSALIGGKGCRVVDETGRALLDLSAGWGAASLGHGHPAIVDAVTATLANPAGASVLSSANLPSVELAEALLARLPSLGDHKVWFGHSGSDANETVFRAVVAATGRRRVLAFEGAYHGGTTASMAISGHTVQAHATRHPGLTLIPYPSGDPPREGAVTGSQVLERVDELLRTPDPAGEFGALFIEPIQSDGGMLVPPSGFLAALVERCRARGVLIVDDEVKVGLGRSGKLHCFEHEGFTPDVVVFGKGLGGGLPIAAAVAPARILDFAPAFAMQTLHGNPAAAAAGLAVLETIARDDLVGNALAVGNALLQGLKELQLRQAAILDVRGRGLAIGVELDTTNDPRIAAKVVYRAYELGVVLYYVGLSSNVLELTPPLTLSLAEADEALSLIERAVADVAAGRFDGRKLAAFTGW